MGAMRLVLACVLLGLGGTAVAGRNNLTVVVSELRLVKLCPPLYSSGITSITFTVRMKNWFHVPFMCIVVIFLITSLCFLLYILRL